MTDTILSHNPAWLDHIEYLSICKGRSLLALYDHTEHLYIRLPLLALKVSKTLTNPHVQLDCYAKWQSKPETRKEVYQKNSPCRNQGQQNVKHANNLLYPNIPIDVYSIKHWGFLFKSLANRGNRIPNLCHTNKTTIC